MRSVAILALSSFLVLASKYLVRAFHTSCRKATLPGWELIAPPVRCSVAVMLCYVLWCVA